MRRGTVGVLVLLCGAVVAAASGGVVAADDHDGGPFADDDGAWVDADRVESDDWAERAPYVDAGLDQEVYVGDEVFLDGAGSWDDQGDVVRHEWEIETPDGTTIEPECPTCWFTSFRANQRGEHAVTLSVEDGEGFENADTLYVRVQPLEAHMVDAGGSGGDGGGCYAGNVGANDNNNVCDVHGQILDLQTADTGGVAYYVVDGNAPGIAGDYSESHKDDDGNILVDPITLENEMRELFEAHIGESNSDRGAADDFENGGGDTPSATEAMSYDTSDNEYADQAGIL